MTLNIVTSTFYLHKGETSRAGVDMMLYISNLGMYTSDKRDQVNERIQNAELEDHPDTDWDYLQEEFIKYNFQHYHYLYSAFFISFYSLYERSLKELGEKICEHTGSSRIGKKSGISDSEHYIQYLETWFDIPREADYEMLEDFREIRNAIVHNDSDYSFKDREKYIDRYPEHFAKVPNKTTFYILDNAVYSEYINVINRFFNSFTVKENIVFHDL